jgi:hypothetical protein
MLPGLTEHSPSPSPLLQALARMLVLLLLLLGSGRSCPRWGGQPWSLGRDCSSFKLLGEEGGGACFPPLEGMGRQPFPSSKPWSLLRRLGESAVEGGGRLSRRRRCRCRPMQVGVGRERGKRLPPPPPPLLQLPRAVQPPLPFPRCLQTCFLAFPDGHPYPTHSAEQRLH